MADQKKTFPWKLIVAIVLLLALVAASRIWPLGQWIKSALPLGDWMKEFTTWTRDHGALGMTIFVVSYGIGATLFLPASLFTVAAGVAFGFGPGVLLALLGAALGAALSFLISRHIARGLVEKRLAKNEKLKAFDAAIAREGWKVVLLLRLVPLFPFPVGNYFFGLTKVGFWPFFLASMAGILPGTSLYVYLGYIGKIALGESRAGRTKQEYVLLAFGLVATIAVVVYITRLAQKSLRQIEERARTDAP